MKNISKLTPLVLLTTMLNIAHADTSNSMESPLTTLNGTSRAGVPLASQARLEKWEIPPSYFINRNYLRCGGSDVLIHTACIDNVEMVSYCFNQHIIIYDGKTNHGSSINYNHALENGTQQFIAKVDCVGVAGKEYLILESTNFGNCDVCEWFDVYSVVGKYLGSSKGLYDARNFVHSPLSPRLDRLLSSKMVSEIASTEILRARVRQPSFKSH